MTVIENLPQTTLSKNTFVSILYTFQSLRFNPYHAFNEKNIINLPIREYFMNRTVNRTVKLPRGKVEKQLAKTRRDSSPPAPQL